MKLYINNGRYVGTKAEAGKHGTLEEVPVDKPGLIAYLNAMADVIAELVAQAAAAPEQSPAPAFLAPERPDPLRFDDAWEEMPMARKAHFAALFCEEARVALRPAPRPGANIHGLGPDEASGPNPEYIEDEGEEDEG